MSINDLHRYSRNMVVFNILNVVVGLVMVISFWWSVVEFLLYLFNNNPFNFTSVWVLGSGVLFFIVFYAVVLMIKFYKSNKFYKNNKL